MIMVKEGRETKINSPITLDRGSHDADRGAKLATNFIGDANRHSLGPPSECRFRFEITTAHDWGRLLTSGSDLPLCFMWTNSTPFTVATLDVV
jgi:hypothetical protein